MFSSLLQVEQAVAGLCQQNQWEVARDEWGSFCQAVDQHYRRSKQQTSAVLQSIIANYYLDRHRVQRALDASDPGYQTEWLAIDSEIKIYLGQRRIPLHDAIQLNEYSPDICAFATLKRTLPRFYFGCRFSTYIQVVTDKAAKEWRRAWATRKRGGPGISSAEQRRLADPQRISDYQRVYYLSQPSVIDPSKPMVEAVAEDFDLIGVAESQILVAEIAAEVAKMTDDTHFDLIQTVWRELLLERQSVPSLATRYGIQVPVMNRIKRRLVRRIRPILAAWRLQQEEAA